MNRPLMAACSCPAKETGVAKDDVLEPIRVRAYFLWEQAGRPEGGDLAFWDEARRQIEAEDSSRASLDSTG